jgi:hypothetical protein
MPAADYDYPIVGSSNGINHEGLLKRGSQYLLYRFTADNGRSMVVKYDYRALLSIAQENLKGGRQPHQFSDEALRAAQRVANLHNNRLNQLRKFFREGIPEGYAESVILNVPGEWVRHLTTCQEFQALFEPHFTFTIPTVAHYQEYIPELADPDTLWFRFSIPELLEAGQLELNRREEFFRNYQAVNDACVLGIKSGLLDPDVFRQQVGELFTRYWSEVELTGACAWS